MRTAWLIAAHDLRLFLRAKSSWVWLLLVPLIFIGFMGYAFKKGKDPENARPGVLIENHDTNFLSRVLLDELGSQGLRLLPAEARDEAQRRIVIPPDFTTRVLNGQQAKVQYLQKQDQATAEGAIVELRLLRSLIVLNSRLMEVASANGGQLNEPMLAAAGAAMPLVELKASFAGRQPSPAGFAFSLPGNLVMYTMLNLMLFGGVSLARERQCGIIRRLALNSATRAQTVAGKAMGLILLGLVQTIVLLLAGHFLFGVLLPSPLSVLLVLLVCSWVAGACGILAGSLMVAEDKVTAVCLLSALGMSALGGCWWPLEIGPDFMKTLAHCFPTGWAMDALHNLISFGGTLADVRLELAVLGGFGFLATVLAARCFRWS